MLNWFQCFHQFINVTPPEITLFKVWLFLNGVRKGPLKLDHLFSQVNGKPYPQAKLELGQMGALHPANRLAAYITGRICPTTSTITKASITSVPVSTVATVTTVTSTSTTTTTPIVKSVGKSRNGSQCSAPDLLLSRLLNPVVDVQYIIKQCITLLHCAVVLHVNMCIT